MRGPASGRMAGLVVIGALAMAAACSSTVDLTGESVRPPHTTRPVISTVPVVTTTTTTPVAVRTTVPRTTTTVAPSQLPELTEFDVDIVWHTDLADGSPERAAIEDAFVVALLSGLEGPSEFTVLAFEDDARLRDAIVMVMGMDPDEAMEQIERFAGTAYWYLPGGEDEPLFFVLLEVDGYDLTDPFWIIGPTVIHEWFHLHQYVTTRPFADGARWAGDEWIGSEFDAAAPEWLVEGSARWFERDALEAAGLAPDGNEVLREWLDGWNRPADGLAAWEDEAGFFAGDITEAYNVAGGAVDLLVEIAGEEAVLDTYWHVRDGAPEPSWRDIFRLVFGLTPGQFYEQVDEAAGWG